MIRADVTGIGNLARDLAAVAKDAPKVFAQATSSVARASKTEAKREITAIYGLKQSRVDAGLNVSSAQFVVTTRASGRGVTLREFGGRQTARGYSAVVRKGSRKVTRGGFTPKKFSGLPFKRIGSASMPIKVLYGPSVAKMLRNKEVSERFILIQAARARAELTRRLFRELKGK